MAVEPSNRTDTRARLIKVAARHFADHGFQGTSQRAIQREVGVNPAAVHYYFGSKAALYQAVVDTFIERLQSERLTNIETIAAGLEPRVRAQHLLAAYVGPHIRLGLSDEGYDYARILARLQFEPPDETADIVGAAVASVRERLIDELSLIFPKATRGRLAHAYTMAMALMAIAPFRARQAGLGIDQARRITDQTAAYAAAGFETMCGGIVQSID
jgi:AcrR family transcriptional regulator